MLDEKSNTKKKKKIQKELRRERMFLGQLIKAKNRWLKGRDRNTVSLSGVNISLFNSIYYKMDRLQYNEP